MITWAILNSGNSDLATSIPDLVSFLKMFQVDLNLSFSGKMMTTFLWMENLAILMEAEIPIRNCHLYDIHQET